ncbi:glycosyl transferase [Klebsiella pneumoniae]|nr:glycosyl transferase [Klebsiella pneumoniae]
MKKILIMTPDIEGPVRNGGIGTAFTVMTPTY